MKQIIIFLKILYFAIMIIDISNSILKKINFTLRRSPSKFFANSPIYTDTTLLMRPHKNRVNNIFHYFDRISVIW